MIVLAILGLTLILGPVLLFFIEAIRFQKITFLLWIVLVASCYIIILSNSDSAIIKTWIAFSLLPVLFLFMFISKKLRNEQQKPSSEEILDSD